MKVASTTLLTALGPILYSYGAKRRALNSDFFIHNHFHALHDNLKPWISNKRTWVSNAVSAPISTFAAPTNKFGTRLSIVHLCLDTIQVAPSRGICAIFPTLSVIQPHTFILWMKPKNPAYPLPSWNPETNPKYKHSSYESNLRIWPTHLVFRNWETNPKHSQSSYESNFRIWLTHLVFRNRETNPKHKHSSYESNLRM